MPDPMAAAPPRRRRFTLSVRSLMVLVLLIGGPIGWKARRAGVQRRAVAEVKRQGGQVEYDWQRRFRELAEGDVTIAMGPQPSGPPAPRWIRRRVGNAWFQEVVGVELPMGCRGDRGPMTPAEQEAEEKAMAAEQLAREADQLACLDGLDRLESLSLDDSDKLNAEGLERLGRLSGLKTLWIREVDARVAAVLGRLTRLEELTVRSRWREATPDDDGEPKPLDLAFLDRLPQLRELTLQVKNTSLDGPALKSLRGLSKLKRLELYVGDGPIPGDAIGELMRAIPGLEVYQ